MVYSSPVPDRRWQNTCKLSTAQDRDILLRAGPHSTLVHSLVLAAVSPFMEATFRFDGYKTKKVVNLSMIVRSEIAFKQIVSYFYCRWINLTDDSLLEILNASAFLMCEQLTLKCSEFLLKRLSAENCFRTWIIAELYNLPHLALVCRDFLRELIPSVTEYINVEKIPDWFLDILFKSMGSELCSSSFNLIVQLQKLLPINSAQYNIISKLLLSSYFNEDSCFSVIWPGSMKQTSFVRELGLIDSERKRDPSRHSVVTVKEEGDPSIALFCTIGKCWTSLNLSKDYGSILGVVNRVYLVFLCSKTHTVTLYHMPSANIFPIKNVFPKRLAWMEKYNLSRAYFVSSNKLYIAFSTRNLRENTVLLNVFSYCIVFKKWKLCLHANVPGTWNMCNIQALTTQDDTVYIIMHAYFINLLPNDQLPDHFLPANNFKSFIFWVDLEKRKVKGLNSINQKHLNKPVFIINGKEYILLDHKLYQSQDKPLTWNGRLQVNNTGDEICYNVPLSTTPIPCLRETDISNVFCVTHIYMATDSLVIAQHRAPTVLWVFDFNLHTRKLIMLPPVPVNATNKNIQVSSFYSSVPLSSILKKTVKTIVRDKCYFKNMIFDESLVSSTTEMNKT